MEKNDNLWKDSSNNIIKDDLSKDKSSTTTLFILSI